MCFIVSERDRVGISAEKIIAVVSLDILIVEPIDTFVLGYNYRGEEEQVCRVFWLVIVME